MIGPHPRQMLLGDKVPVQDCPVEVGEPRMIPEEHHNLLVTCHLGPVQRAALAETIADRATIVFLDELDATSRLAALSSATVLLAHNTAQELRGNEFE